MKVWLIALLTALSFGVAIPVEAGLLKSGTKTAVAAAIIKKIVISKKRFPESAKHIKDAQKAAGAPKVLTIDRAGALMRRRAALKGKGSASGKDRDEYPPAISQERCE